MVMGSVTLNTGAEWKKLLNNNTRTRVDTQIIGTKKNTFQLKLKNQIRSTRITSRHTCYLCPGTIRVVGAPLLTSATTSAISDGLRLLSDCC